MLRAIIIFSAALSFLVSCSGDSEFNGKFGYSPEFISPGDEVTIMYNSDSTLLAGMDEIKCIAYLYNNELINTVDVSLTQSGSVYSGKIKTTNETLGILLKFKSDDELDNNDKNGYLIPLTDSEGNKIAGSTGGYAGAINRWGAYYLDLDRDKEKALKLLTEEFNTNPQVKTDFLQPYFEAVYAVKLDERKKIITTELQAIEKKDEQTEKDYELLAQWYSKLDNEEKANYYAKTIEEKFPKSKFLQEKLYLEYRTVKNVNNKIKLLNQFEEDFPESKYIKTMYDLIANSYRDTRDYDKALEFLQRYKNKVSPYRFYIINKRMLEENSDLDIALQIASIGEERNLLEVDNPSVEKPEYLSISEWKTEREYELGLNQFVYGKILYKAEKRLEALPILKEAVRLTNRKDGEINELYSKALVETGNFNTALDEIAAFIKTGNSTVRMKDYLQEAYINEKGTTQGFEAFAAKFENVAKEKLISKLKNEIILEPAPQFSLVDLEGESVSLSNFKGKIVIVDFWATWCGPCLASFPGMKKAVEKYQDNENVKFLFINSWERVEDKKANAEKFVTKNDYPFHVLLDDENEVIEKFRVSGIPTKFIVDGNSNIRFKSVGFQGTDDQLVEELSLMISMVNEF